jgi:hypothetical protein
MHFPKYWGKGAWTGLAADGSEVRRVVWRSSDESPAHAEALAREAAQNLGRAFTRGARDRYPYADRALREPVLREVSTGDAASDAVVTRTAYGSEVLNAPGAMFVDVDLAEPETSTAGWLAGWKRMFGGKPPAPEKADPAAGAHLETLVRWQAANPGWAFRVYRTHSGLRYLATSALHDPASERTHATLAALGCDARYRQLCKVQKSFRARLTPKPWRCGCDNPPVRFPYEDGRREEQIRQWIDLYTQAARGFATCHFVQTVGCQATHPAIARVMAEHDAQTKADSGLPLA